MADYACCWCGCMAISIHFRCRFHRQPRIFRRWEEKHRQQTVDGMWNRLFSTAFYSSSRFMYRTPWWLSLIPFHMVCYVLLRCPMKDCYKFCASYCYRWFYCLLCCNLTSVSRAMLKLAKPPLRIRTNSLLLLHNFFVFFYNRHSSLCWTTKTTDKRRHRLVCLAVCYLMAAFHWLGVTTPSLSVFLLLIFLVCNLLWR